MRPLLEAFRAITQFERTPALLLNEAGQIVAQNDAVQRFLPYAVGVSLADTLGEPFAAFIDAAAAGAAPVPGRFVFDIKDGEARKLRCEAGACRIGEARGILVRVFEEGDDLRRFSELRRQLAAVDEEMRRRKQSENRLRLVIETARDGVIMFDARGVIALANPACEAMFHASPGALVGEQVASLTPREAQGDVLDGDVAAFWRPGGGHPDGRIGAVAQRRDGVRFPLELAVQRGVGPMGDVYVAILRDVTQQRMLQDQLAQSQKMEAIGQLAGGVAHDFNNLLTVIIGGAEALIEGLAQDGVQDGAAEDAARSILTAGQRGADLSRALLAFARRQPLRPMLFDCASRIIEMRDLLRRTLKADIALELRPGIASLPVLADPGQLDAAILNLCINAQDAMKRGGDLLISASAVTLDADEATARSLPPGRYARLAVSDTGAGIPAELIPHVRQPFFTTKGVGLGTGLGLAQVDGYAAQSGGGMRISSVPGAGTTVELFLPLMTTTQMPNNEVPMEDAAVPVSFSASVLVVEDDPMVRSLAVRILASLNCSVMTAEDGKTAIELLKSTSSIDLVFTDMVLPGAITGIDIVRCANEQRPGVLCAIASGYATEIFSENGRVPPGVAVLPKPYRKADLAQLVSRIRPRGPGC